MAFVSGCCEGERCSFEGCSTQAEHKVEETIFPDDPFQHRHELTAYVCHHHFRLIMGPAADRAEARAQPEKR
jgi:hypothetical protein